MSQAAKLDNSQFGPGVVVQHLTGDTGGIISPDNGNNINLLGGTNIQVDGNQVANTLRVRVIDAPIFAGTVTTNVNFVSTAGNLVLPQTTFAMGQIKIGAHWTCSADLVGSIGEASVFIGDSCGHLLPGITAVNNIGIGSFCGQSLTSGSGNVLLGGLCGTILTDQVDNICIGKQAGSQLAGSYNVLIGSTSGPVATSNNNVGIGLNSLLKLTTASATAVGAQALSSLTTGLYCSAFGINAAPKAINSTALTAIGYNSLLSCVNGTGTAVGGNALRSLTSGTGCCAFGVGAAYSLTTSVGAVAIGDQSLFNAVTSLRSTAVGYHALFSVTNTHGNTALGYGAGVNITGSENVALGDGAMEGSVGSTGSNNIAIGQASLRDLGSASNCIAIGNSAASSITSGIDNIALGTTSLALLKDGTDNIGIGIASLGNIIGGASNIGIGTGAGSSLEASDSLNICIDNLGVAGDNETIRIGSVHQDTYIAGIYGSTIGATNGVVVCDNTADGGKLATVTAGTPGDVLIMGATAPEWHSPDGGLVWSEKTVNFTLAKSNGYFINNNGAVVIATLPVLAAVGDTFKLLNIDKGWQINQNAGQSIKMGPNATTIGVGGNLKGTVVGDSVEIICYIADTEFWVISSFGNIVGV